MQRSWNTDGRLLTVADARQVVEAYRAYSRLRFAWLMRSAVKQGHSPEITAVFQNALNVATPEPLADIVPGMRIHVRGQNATVEGASHYGHYQCFPQGMPKFIHVRYDNGVQDTIPAAVPMTELTPVEETH